MEDNGITSEDKELLAKLKELIKKDKLEETELDDLRDMIKIYESFKVFGRFARIARNIVIFVGSFLVGWFVLIDNLHVVWNKIISVFGG